jgi:hypothetical protein
VISEFTRKVKHELVKEAVRKKFARRLVRASPVRFLAVTPAVHDRIANAARRKTL